MDTEKRPRNAVHLARCARATVKNSAQRAERAERAESAESGELQLCLAQSVYKNKLQRQRERRFGSRVKSRLGQLMNDTTRAPASFGPSVYTYKIKSPHSAAHVAPARSCCSPNCCCLFKREKPSASASIIMSQRCESAPREIWMPSDQECDTRTKPPRLGQMIEQQSPSSPCFAPGHNKTDYHRTPGLNLHS